MFVVAAQRIFLLVYVHRYVHSSSKFVVLRLPRPDLFHRPFVLVVGRTGRSRPEEA